MLTLPGKCLVCFSRSSGLWVIVSMLYINILYIIISQISAGLFWASEGAVALGYPEPRKRGRYLK